MEDVVHSFQQSAECGKSFIHSFADVQIPCFSFLDEVMNLIMTLGKILSMYYFL